MTPPASSRSPTSGSPAVLTTTRHLVRHTLARTDDLPPHDHACPRAHPRRFTTRTIHEGHLDATGQLWSTTGQLLAERRPTRATQRASTIKGQVTDAPTRSDTHRQPPRRRHSRHPTRKPPGANRDTAAPALTRKRSSQTADLALLLLAVAEVVPDDDVRLRDGRQSCASRTTGGCRRKREKSLRAAFSWMLAEEPDVDPARVPEATGAPIRRHRRRDRN